MRIALIGPPFIEIPPRRYGGTELFIANLACELHARGHDVTVYGNGDSRLPCSVKWTYAHADWPPDNPVRVQLKNADHAAWAIRDASRWADLIHLNDLVALPMTRFVDLPAVLTIHHPHEPLLSEHYLKYPDVHYVAIAQWLAQIEPMPLVHVIHHGIPTDAYTYSQEKSGYLAFLGRMAPCKGPHLAIQVSLRTGLKLTPAGEIQPQFQQYWHEQIEPFIDGHQITYIGEADFETKNALLAGASAMLFPIQWKEPFGLVMVEAMACGTPVLAFSGGAVEEVVTNGVSGWICRDLDEMCDRALAPGVMPASCHDDVQRRFSVSAMADAYLAVYTEALEATVRPPHKLGGLHG